MGARGLNTWFGAGPAIKPQIKAILAMNPGEVIVSAVSRLNKTAARKVPLLAHTGS